MGFVRGFGKGLGKGLGEGIWQVVGEPGRGTGEAAFAGAARLARGGPV